jgi:Starch synthase catalytic domain
MPNLAFVAYESPFAPAGGIAAVMGQLPRVVQEISSQRTIVITPWDHKAWRRSADDKLRPPNARSVGSVTVTFHGREIRTQVKLDSTTFGVEFHFIEPEPPEWKEAPLFAGEPHPYRVPHEILIRDSFFFSTAVIRTLTTIAAGDWVLFLQDWETGAAALYHHLVDVGVPVQCLLTLHNSYDSGGITPARWTENGINLAALPGGIAAEKPSFLERVLPVVRRQVFTVSTQFGKDILVDILITKVMGRQLPAPLRGRIMGVDNGPFAPTLDTELHNARQRLDSARTGEEREPAQSALNLLVAKSDALFRARAGDHEAFSNGSKGEDSLS